jgi:hypothetical protein
MVSDVRIMSRIREEMEEEIQKAASGSNSDDYICPFCDTHMPKEQLSVHKETCTELL